MLKKCRWYDLARSGLTNEVIVCNTIVRNNNLNLWFVFPSSSAVEEQIVVYNYEQLLVCLYICTQKGEWNCCDEWDWPGRLKQCDSDDNKKKPPKEKRQVADYWQQWNFIVNNNIITTIYK